MNKKNCTKPEPEALEAFVRRMIETGGAIVTSEALSAGEIAVSRACGKMFVTPEGYGLHLKPKQWLADQHERMMWRLCNAALHKSKPKGEHGTKN